MASSSSLEKWTPQNGSIASSDSTHSVRSANGRSTPSCRFRKIANGSTIR